MRPGRLLTALVLALLPTAAVRSESVLYQATVIAPEAVVRSGPSNDPKMYPTNRLRQGAVVQVVKELPDGWLAIRPPSGSFSWINMRFLQRDTNNPVVWLVVSHPEVPVPVRMGSEVVNAPPTVEGTRVKRGTMVVAVGYAKTAEDGSWLPIDPPDGEVRYVRAEAVSRPGQTPTFAGAAPPAATPATTSPTTDPRWLRAEAAVKNSDLTEARRLYKELHDTVVNTNHELAMMCLNRIKWLDQMAPRRVVNVTPTTAAPPIASPAPAAPATTVARPTTPMQGGYQLADAGQRTQSTSQYSSPPAGQPYPALAAPVQPQGTPCGPGQVMSGAGRLRLAGRCIDYKRAYALENSRGQILMYVTAQPGVDLESFVHRNVQMCGALVYRGDLRANYMVVSRVMPLP